MRSVSPELSTSWRPSFGRMSMYEKIERLFRPFLGCEGRVAWIMRVWKKTRRGITSPRHCQTIRHKFSRILLSSSSTESRLRACRLSTYHGREGESQVLPFTFYTTLTVVEPPQNRTMIVRLISTAQTGFFYTTQRLRQGPKLSAIKYDPKGPLHFPEFIMKNLSLIFALTSKTARAVR